MIHLSPIHISSIICVLLHTFTVTTTNKNPPKKREKRLLQLRLSYFFPKIADPNLTEYVGVRIEADLLEDELVRVEGARGKLNEHGAGVPCKTARSNLSVI